MLPAPILLAIGANLPDPAGAHPLATCRAAAEALRGLPGLRLTALSRWYATTPMPASAQPDYVNGAARLEGSIDPADLLARLHAIEAAAGRRRTTPNAARPLDLDILAIGDTIRPAPDPILPHPRLHERAFVLTPLCDIAPDWRHPLLGRTARELQATLPPAEAGAVLRVLAG